MLPNCYKHMARLKMIIDLTATQKNFPFRNLTTQPNVSLETYFQQITKPNSAIP